MSLNIIYFGCDISLSVFMKLLDLGHNISALYTYHNPYDLVHEFNITAAARERGIPVCYGKMTSAEAEGLFSSRACDVFVTAEYNARLPIPDCERFKGVNVHNSLLPEGKGFFAVETRRFLRLPYGGVTLHKLTPNFDEGDCLAQKRFPLNPCEDILRIYKKCEHAAAQICGDVFRQDNTFFEYWAAAKPQQGVSSVWYPSKEERSIHTGMTVEQAIHLFLCYDRFTFARTGTGENGQITRVMALHTGDLSKAIGRRECGEELIYTPYALKGGSIWLALEK